MSINDNAYDADPHVAEIYDQLDHYASKDLALLSALTGDAPPRLRIFEPFCGTGRILACLSSLGHQVIGMDQSPAMLARAKARLAAMGPAGAGVRLQQGDATAGGWPAGCDVVVLGSNCLYELGSAAEQEALFVRSAATLRPGGYLYVDSDHMEGPLAPSWTRPGVRHSVFPTGVCADGTEVQSEFVSAGHDPAARVARFRRTMTIIEPGGRRRRITAMKQTHPVSIAEVMAWLDRHAFVVVGRWGDHDRRPLELDSPRVVLWAQRREAR